MVLLLFRAHYVIQEIHTIWCIKFFWGRWCQACSVEPCPCQLAVVPGVTLAPTHRLQPSRSLGLAPVSGDRDLHTRSSSSRSGAWGCGEGALRSTQKGTNERDRVGRDVVVLTALSRSIFIQTLPFTPRLGCSLNTGLPSPRHSFSSPFSTATRAIFLKRK